MYLMSTDNKFKYFDFRRSSRLSSRDIYEHVQGRPAGAPAPPSTAEGHAGVGAGWIILSRNGDAEYHPGKKFGKYMFKMVRFRAKYS